MTPDLSHRLGHALGAHVVTPAERSTVVGVAERSEVWEDLPPDVQALVVEIEARPGPGPIADTPEVASVRTLWTGCSYCLNPRHPGPCAKPHGGDTGGHRKHGGGAGGGGPSAGGSEDEGSMRASLRDAQTTDEISAVVAAEASGITGRKVTCNMTGSDPQVAREHGEAILLDLEVYPHAPLTSIHTFGPGSARPDIDHDAYAITRRGTVSDAIGFNVAYTSDPVKYRTSLKDDGDAGWLSAATPTGVAHHEFGHVLAAHTQAATAAKDRVSVKASRAGTKASALTRDQISAYAATNPRELAAEAFADVATRGQDASPLSLELVSLIDGRYRAAYGES